MKTVFKNPKKVERTWYIIDAADAVLGRLATSIASLLLGKGKPSYSPHHDVGDYVVVVNSEKIRLTGRKEEMKKYFRHTGRPGHGTTLTYSEMKEKNPTGIITHAVKGMLPKNTRGRALMKKLHVYTGEDHPHRAQKPVSFTAAVLGFIVRSIH